MAVKVKMPNQNDVTIEGGIDLQVKDGHLMVEGFVNDPTLAVFAPGAWLSATADSYESRKTARTTTASS